MPSYLLICGRPPFHVPHSHSPRGMLLQAAREYGGEGVIFLIPKYCDPMLFDIPALTQILKEKGFPTLCLDVSGPLSEGQMRVRVEAFVEILSNSSADSIWA